MPYHRLDHGRLKQFKRDRNGYLKAEGWAIRAGVFLYRQADGSIQKELRPENEVFKSDSLETLSSIPITNDHPQQGFVNSKNFNDLSVGFTGEKTERINDHVKVTLNITNDEAIHDH